jgi:hypothetical protein
MELITRLFPGDTIGIPRQVPQEEWDVFLAEHGGQPQLVTIRPGNFLTHEEWKECFEYVENAVRNNPSLTVEALVDSWMGNLPPGELDINGGARPVLPDEETVSSILEGMRGCGKARRELATAMSALKEAFEPAQKP